MAAWRLLAFEALLRAQEGRCFACGHSFEPRLCARGAMPDALANHPRRPSLDHLVPLAAGGPDHWRNLVVACRRCNCAKGHRWPSRRDRTRARTLWLAVPQATRAALNEAKPLDGYYAAFVR